MPIYEVTVTKRYIRSAEYEASAKVIVQAASEDAAVRAATEAAAGDELDDLVTFSEYETCDLDTDDEDEVTVEAEVGGKISAKPKAVFGPEIKAVKVKVDGKVAKIRDNKF